MNKQKRVVAMHDISCVGRCSLTVALPLLSAAGLECSLFPTAVLSTHTGGFENYTFCDLTPELMPILNHWKTLNLTADAVYTGYLASSEQISLAKNLFEYFKKDDNIIFVDPVMADNGKMYAGFDKSFAADMANLCSEADVITPNVTEAAFMLDEPFTEGPYSREYIENLLKKLSSICKGKIILTGVYFDEQNIGAAAYDSTTGKTDYCFGKRLPASVHGTGDVFASVLLGALLNDVPLKNAVQIAVDYVAICIERTLSEKTERRYGVNFEANIAKLIAAIDENANRRSI